MDDTSDPGSLRSAEQRPQLSDDALVGHVLVGQAYPVGVEQRVHTLQTAGQRIRIVEVVREHGNTIAERTLPVRMPGERAHLVSEVEQPSGDISACVAGRSCDDVG